MIEPSPLSFLGGLLLGLASSLHCSAMCGGIGSGLMLVAGAHVPGRRAKVLALGQAGRVMSYLTMGALVGWAGYGLLGGLGQTLGFRLLQWAGAVSLMWIGLATAGLLPPLQVLDRALAPLSAGLRGGLSRVHEHRYAPLMMGLTWGLLPCAMVYAALLTAGLTGSAAGGALVMAGFGLGTVPAVTLSSLGIVSLSRLEAAPALRVAIGLAIAAIGFATVYMSPTMIEWLCRT
jgi:hypothetical protein